MAPTLNDGDRLFIGKQVGQLERGDIVIFHNPRNTSTSFIKRIIALPGEKIRLDADGQLYINDLLLKETSIRGRYPNRLSTRIPTVMMGDNRDASNDSRSYGPVPKRLIYGKMIMRCWPLSQPSK